MRLYLQPKSVDEAVQALSENSLFVLAGGTDYYPAHVGKPLDDDILDITGITDLRGISENDDHFYIGALTRWTDIIEAGIISMGLSWRHAKSAASKSKMRAP